MLEKYFKKEEIEQLKTMAPYARARKLVERVFENTFDKGGNPYLDHLYSVASNLEEEKEKTTGLLHDIIEDKGFHAEDLRKLEFSEEVIEAVLLVSRRKDETYKEFIERILKSNNKLALRVKIADMTNNMDLSRIKNPTEEDIRRVEEKYKKEYKRLIKKMEEIK